MNFTHVVKVYRGDGTESVLYAGFKDDCETLASEYNANYQTDQYKVEDFIPSRWGEGFSW